MTSQIIEALRYQHVPTDKARLFRYSTIEARYGDITVAQEVIRGIPRPGDDIMAQGRVLASLLKDEPLDVGESGTAYRIWQLPDWRHGWGRVFIKRGTLVRRAQEMPSKAEVLACRGQRELTRLADRTSQWATAAVLDGDAERLTEDVDPKLQLTYDIWDDWHHRQITGEPWTAEKDTVLDRQVNHFLHLYLFGEDIGYEVTEAEEFPYGFYFGNVGLEEAQDRFASLPHHESNRLVEVPRALELARVGEPIAVDDHRIIQMVGFFGLLTGTEVYFEHPEAVNKTWPGYFDLIQAAREAKQAIG
jgi:hypothetical protein